MTDRQMYARKGNRAAIRVGVIAFLISAAAAGAGAQAGPQANRYPTPGGQFPTAPQLQIPALPAAPAITPNGEVVEDVIARVNDQIITRTEYERAEKAMVQEAQQQGATQAELDDRLHNLLRDMIDQQILLSKGKELGITGDAETIRQLDEIRKQNHLDSLEALQKAAEQQGVSYEDFKQSIRNQIVSRQVVQSEVGKTIRMTHAQEEAYYEAHKQEFQVPEQVHLSEILIPTPENATDAQVAEAQKKADDAAAQLKAGAKFADVAQKVSGGPTASAGGDLGDFKRGTLGQVLEDATFPLPVGGVTAPIRTRQGFVILRVDAHQAAGVPALKDIEPQVQEAVYMQAMQPAMRAYLSKERDQVYLDIKPGFTDTGSNKKESKPTFTAYAPPKPKKKVLEKQRLEQEKAQRAQEALAAARERVREKQEARAVEQAKKSGVRDVAMPVKPKKVRREKIRYGQAPRLSLPAGVATVAAEDNAPLRGQAAGVAMSPTETVTAITTGTGVDANTDPLSTQTTSDRKTRFADREKQQEEQRAKVKLVKTSAKATARPAEATPAEALDEKQRAAPLGLNGDTSKKKHKRQKGEAKERLQEKPKADAEAAAAANVPVEQTVNPALTGAPVAKTPEGSGSTATPPPQ